MIKVQNLTKRYGSKCAVDGVSFDIEEGRVYGFLGPNGAGKSTTMNIITGCLSSSEGSVEVDGIDIYDDPKAAKRLIGYLPEIPPLYGEMTPREYLAFVARAKGVKGADVEKSVDEVIERTFIERVEGRLIRTLSKGYKQRVGIAQAILGEPKYIILDEPTVGLDPKQIIDMRNLIRDLAHEHTVILSSHILAEVQEVCDELLIISSGKIVASGTQHDITASLGGQASMSITVKGDCDSAVFEGLECKVEKEDGEDARFTLTYPRGTDLREQVFGLLTGAGKTILEMHSNEPTLEDIFLSLTADKVEYEPDEDYAPSVAEAAELLTGGAEEASDVSGSKDDEKPEEDKNDGDDDDYKPLFS